MKLYKLTGKLYLTDDNGAETITDWVGSKAECGTVRSNWISSGKVKRRADITTEDVEVPTSKKELLEWLKANAK